MKEFTLDDMLRLGAENSRLKAAIKKHRDQRGDDRCYLDDAELYEAAGLQPANTALPPKEVFLGNCARFHASRQKEGDKYVTVEEQLTPFKAEIKDLRYVLTNRCPFHYGEDRGDFPKVTHRHFGKHGWGIEKCQLDIFELAVLAVGDEDEKDVTG